ncbi:hypothetical protein AXK56_18700 [Tsukamurella pulmonis]|uniref:PknH-like extracellular domain-containing protein n=1 Tax=Tsukamurella pulmonis TaxID=47312 RepID=A0A1H1HJ44_9ACTN|nr:hypothetical protein [Tsukamurella pulmonis]KXO94655.1 hypothetical protein AXK56_18700 [Tsukamurella pulmonis]SDR25393.1 hypothetical protein SAMN04489765_4256 [Tsukamurella pulmonis]SUP14407.1 Uncharacterised protein [Tsukamurella pulmonis]
MRRSDTNRSLGLLAAVAASGLLLTACGGGGDEPSAPPSSAPPVDEAKLLTQADLPEGFALATVPPDTAFQSAMQAFGQVQAAEITPATCKDKNVALQQELLETIKYGGQQTVSQGATNYGVTLLPNSARLSVFEAAGTGECSSLSYGTVLKQTTTRAALPADVVGADGFILEATRTGAGQTVRSASAYFTKNGVLAMVSANPNQSGAVDEPVFEDLIRRVAGKL